MNSLFEPKLKSNYFNFKSPWLFNSKDLLPFLYLALGLIISACIILFLCFYTLLGSFTGPTPSPPPSAQANSIVLPSHEASTQSTEPSPVVLSFEEQLKSAQEQPTYELQLQAYQNLIENNDLNEEQTALVRPQITQLEKKLASSKQIISTAESYMNKQYYSAAIKLIAPILEEGKIWGNYYTQALETKEKAFFKRVDYYLIKGRLPQAKQALQKAIDAEMNAEQIKDYQDKIQKLEKIG